MSPHVLCPDGMVRITLKEKMLEEAHVLQTEDGYLMLRLVYHHGHGWILAV